MFLNANDPRLQAMNDAMARQAAAGLLFVVVVIAVSVCLGMLMAWSIRGLIRWFFKRIVSIAGNKGRPPSNGSPGQSDIISPLASRRPVAASPDRALAALQSRRPPSSPA